MYRIEDYSLKQRSAILKSLGLSNGESINFIYPSRTTNFSYIAITTNRFAFVRTAWGQIPLSAFSWSQLDRVAITAEKKDTTHFMIDFHSRSNEKYSSIADHFPHPVYESFLEVIQQAYSPIITHHTWSDGLPVRSVLPGNIKDAANNLLRNSHFIHSEILLGPGIGLLLTDTHLIIASAGLLARPPMTIPLSNELSIKLNADQEGETGMICGELKIRVPSFEIDIPLARITVRESEMLSLLSKASSLGPIVDIDIRTYQQIKSDRLAATEKQLRQKYVLTGIESIPKRYFPSVSAQINQRPFHFGIMLGGNEAVFMLITDRALTITGPGSWGGVNTQTYDFDKISGLSVNTGVIDNHIQILTNSGKETFVFERDAEPFVREFTVEFDKIRRLENTNSNTVNSQPTSTSGLAEDIAKLAQLRDAGVLTEEEFSLAKARLLHR